MYENGGINAAFIILTVLWDIIPPLQHVREIKHKTLALFPAETRIGYRLAVNSSVNLLTAILDVAFYHQTLYHSRYVAVMSAGMQNLLAYAYLLKILLVGIAVVDVNYHSRIFQIALGVHIVEKYQILIMIILHSSAVLVYRTAQNGMSERIALRLDFPAAVEERMAYLSRLDGIKHNAQVAAGRILHSDRHADSARRQSVLLIFHRARSYCHI